MGLGVWESWYIVFWKGFQKEKTCTLRESGTSADDPLQITSWEVIYLCESKSPSMNKDPPERIRGKTNIAAHKRLWLAGHQWLTPVILAIQEAEISRIAVRNQPRQIVHKILSWKKPFRKKGLVEWLKM
jgi:hypothetical protein